MYFIVISLLVGNNGVHSFYDKNAVLHYYHRKSYSVYMYHCDCIYLHDKELLSL